MSERGVFAVDRGIWSDPDFAAEPFTEREAFLWLVSEAAWKPHRKRVGSKLVELARGQSCHSVRFMAEAWQWSKSRVDRFLDRLEERDTIKRVSGTEPLVITICKYDEFQRVSLPERDSDGTLDGTAAGQQRDRLEDRENKEYPSKATPSRESSSEPAVPPRSPRRHVWPDDYRDRVWRAYGKAVEKKPSMAALEALHRADTLDFGVLMDGIGRQAAAVEPQYRPALHRWLRREQWNDVHATGPPPRAAGPRNEFARIALEGLHGRNLFDPEPAEPAGTVEIIPPDHAEPGAGRPRRPAAQPDRADAGWPHRDPFDARPERG